MVRLVQCLCGANRHAILAIAYEEGKVEDGVDELRKKIAELLASRAINPWCGICHSRQEHWQYEDSPTKFETMDEALPALREIEQANRRARGILGQAGRN